MNKDRWEKTQKTVGVKAQTMRYATCVTDGNGTAERGGRMTNKNEMDNGMSLVELQAILGQRIKIANDKTLDLEERRKETEISQTISSLAKQMINNADVVLRTEKLIAEGKLVNSTIGRMIDHEE